MLFRYCGQYILGSFAASLLSASLAAAKPIQHDAEHYVLLHQYQDQWAAGN